MSIQYATDSTFAYQIKKLIALAYVPLTDVTEHYNLLIDSPYYKRNEERLSPMLDYFEDTWVGRLHRSGHRRQPKYQIAWWNVYLSTLNKEAKTNNAVEGWHNAFQATTGRGTPTLHKLIQSLQKEQSYQELRMEQSVTLIGPKLTKETKKMYNTLQSQVTLYPTSKGLEYLSMIAKTIL